MNSAVMENTKALSQPGLVRPTSLLTGLSEIQVLINVKLQVFGLQVNRSDCGTHWNSTVFTSSLRHFNEHGIIRIK